MVTTTDLQHLSAGTLALLPRLGLVNDVTQVARGPLEPHRGPCPGRTSSIHASASTKVSPTGTSQRPRPSVRLCTRRQTGSRTPPALHPEVEAGSVHGDQEPDLLVATHNRIIREHRVDAHGRAPP